jgi:hypothetical protein
MIETQLRLVDLVPSYGRWGITRLLFSCLLAIYYIQKGRGI